MRAYRERVPRGGAGLAVPEAFAPPHGGELRKMRARPCRRKIRVLRSSCCDLYPCLPPNSELIRNVYGSIARGHLRAFGVAHYHAHQIGSWFDIKTGFERETGVAEAFERLIEQFHFDNFLAAGHEIPVLVKNGGGDGEIVEVASIALAEMDSF